MFTRMITRIRYNFKGRVQGVGFRYTACKAAEACNLTGFVKNEWDGSVTVEAQGEARDIGRMLKMIEQGRFIEIESRESKKLPIVEDERSFRVEGGYF